jgi:hypothetical protein
VFAQASIAGVVRDTSGAVLPGVTVEAASPALIEKVRTVVTDGSGEYKIVDLRPGTYTVTFTLTGFNVVKRDGIELTGTFVATVNAELKVGSVTETITVTSQTPIVDVQSVTEQRVLPSTVVDAIPSGKSLADLGVLIPGFNAVQTNAGFGVNPMDVGGTNNLQNTFLVIHDSRYTDQRTFVNGIPIRNILGEGNSTNFTPDVGSTQEVVVDFGAGSAEQMTPLRVNYVPKDGGNMFHGTFFATGANSSFQGSNYSQALQTAGLTSPNRLKAVADINPNGGGPVIADKLWFYSSLRYQENQTYLAGLYQNLNGGNPNAWSYVPNLSQQDLFSITQWSFNTRITWQLNAQNKLSFYAEDQPGREWASARALVAPESTTNYRFPTNRMETVSWTSTLSNKLLVEASAMQHGEVWMDIGPAALYGTSVAQSLIPVAEQGGSIPGLVYRGLAAGAYAHNSMPNIWQGRASLSYVTGSHAFKFGFEDLWGTTTSSFTDDSSSLSYRFNNGVPNQITERSTPYDQIWNLNELGAFAQDRWTMKQLTLNVGVRFDRYTTGFPATTFGPGPLVPTRDLVVPASPFYDWKDLTPRLGSVYDLFGNGKTALKVNLNKYVLGVTPANGVPAANFANSVTRSWKDNSPVGSPAYYTPQCNLLNPLANGDCGTVSDLNFGAPTVSTRYDPATLAGWGVRPVNWEFSAGVQQQLLPRVGLSVGYFRRWYQNFVATDNLATAASDYGTYSIPAPLDPRLPAGGGYVIGGLYNLNPNRVGQVSNLVTFASNLGGQTEHWNGVDANLNVRLQSNALLQAGLSTGRTMTNDCNIVNHYLGAVTVFDSIVAYGTALPAGTLVSTQMCDQHTPFLTQVKLLGTYTVPRVDVQFAATFQSYPGPNINANYVALNSLIAPSLGRPLSGGAANATVDLVSPGALYGDRANELDFRIGKVLRFGRVRTNLHLDVYNLLNANAITSLNSSVASTSTASWQTPTNIMNPRLFKFGVQVDF